MEPEKLIIAQKWMTQTANAAAVPVFLHSQVLESLVPENAQPSRCETQDISTAVLEGTDVFVLSHETSVGCNAVQACVLLAKSIAEAENIFDHDLAYQQMRDRAMSEQQPSVSDILCSTATQIALDNNVDMFVTVTKTGKIARQLARQRPMQTILACSILSNVVH